MSNKLQEILKISKIFALDQAEKSGLPCLFHIELSYNKGQVLAGQLKANEEIVGIGTYLMDCMLGEAFAEGRKEDHVEMSEEKAREIMAEFGLDKEVEDNILACVSQHHGANSFHSIEAEICCNADCYRFISIEGFIGGIHNGRKMNLPALLGLYGEKADEKWNVLTLDLCKTELEPQ